MEQQIISGIIGKLKDNLYSNHSKITGLSFRKANYTKPKTYEYLTDYEPLEHAQLFTGCDTVFIKGNITFPIEIRSDEDYEDCLFLSLQNIGGIVYIDGEPYHGIDQNRDRIPLRKEWAGQTKELLIEGYYLNVCYNLDNIVPTYLAYANFRRVDKKIEQYIYDLQLANEWYLNECAHPQEDNLIIRKRITAAFEASIQYLDLTLTGDAFRNGVIEADTIFRGKLAEIDDGDVRSHFSLVASTHIDTAWLWQLKDTIRKCAHSFSNMLRLMDIYPDFKFSSSQVKLLAYTKEYYPALYEQIKQAAKDGRWENVGSMWVESDCNVVSGEAMVRQILHGVKFLEEEFGSRPKLAWLPDTFGFQPNLPQIFKKSGTDYFYSYKLHWQAQEKFPYGDFKWKGIDGSEIIGAVINNPMGAYNGYPNPAMITRTKEAFEQQGEVDEVLFSYGYGDGGGGANRDMVEYAKRLGDFPGLPKCEMSTAQEFFDRLEGYREVLPTWYGELYIQTHRGTLTTEASVKENNRRAEMLLPSLEKLAVMAEQCGAKPDWALLYEAWEKALVLQFHDILPGSSIDAVYRDCREIYQEIFEMADRFVESLGIDTKIRLCDGGRVVNTLSWDRDVLTTIQCPVEDIGDGAVKIIIAGETVPCQVTRKGEMEEITFLAKNVKALSCVDFEVITERKEAAGETTATTRVSDEAAGETTATNKALEKVTGRTMSVTKHQDGITVDNDRYLAVIDNMGQIVSLWDKRAARQVLSAPGNGVRFFLDGPSIEDAWNLYENYKTREVTVFTDTNIALTENNDLRTVIHVHRVGQHIDFAQDIIFYHDKERIDFKTCVDWQEKNKVMRVYFPTTMNAPYFTSEVGFGAYSRPTVGNTKYEKSKFEVAAHRFTDISENGYGVALLNDSKYGHDVQYNTIGLTLLRSTGFPARYPDLGIHHFTYSLLPHMESWDKAQVAQAAIELNAEIHTISAISKNCLEKGTLMNGLFKCSHDNLIIEAIKKTESGDGIVVRLYEACGTSGSAELSCGKHILSAVESDLVEKKIKDAELTEDTISFRFTPYEIKTFIVTLK